MTKFLILVFIVFAAQALQAETLKTVFNPFTSKFDYITRLDASTTITVGPIILTDANNCRWSTGVNTSGVLTTASLGCPSILMEDGTYILMEDSSKILVE